MALQNQTYANSGYAYYGNPADWSNFSTLNSTISFNDTDAKLIVIPAIPDKDTTIAFNGNQLAYVSDIPDLANWAQYPANNDVTIPAPYALRAETAFISSLTVYTETVENTVNVSSFVTSTLIANESITASKLQNSTITILADNQNFPLESPSLNITSKNGLGGNITLTADSGTGFVGGGLITLQSKGGTAFLGLNGAVDIIAESGSSGVVGVTTGGRIDITANSGINDVSLTSAVKISGAGVNIQSGITSPITSVAGYTFIGGNLGVNSCAGIPPIIPNVPGTNYIYGTNGIELNSDVYTTDVYPYWDGLTNPDDLTLHGRTVNVGLGSYNAMVGLSNVSVLAFETAGTRKGGAITGLSSINGLNTGQVGAIQYSDGAGAFQGNSGLLYNGISRITNSAGNNFIDIQEVANSNSIAIQTPNQINLTAQDLIGVNGGLGLYLTGGTFLKVDIANSLGTPGQVLTSDGTFTTWEDIPNISKYASFSSDLTQPLLAVNTPQVITHNTTETNSGGFNLTAGSIQVSATGFYEIGTSIQFYRLSGASVTTINFWFRINGIDIPRSCSQTSMTGNNSEFLATVSIIPYLTAGDVISIVMGGADTTVECLAVLASATPLIKPAIPSIITNIKLLSSNGGGGSSQVYQATYYKSVSQNLTSPNTDITFDLDGAWNNPNGYITHTSGSADFTVVRAGLYFLEFNASISANGATWNNGVNKSVSIDITRIGIAEQAVIQNSVLVAISLNYTNSVSATYYLQVGDIINFRNVLAFATATPSVLGVQNTFDLNTFASWRFIS